VVGIVGWRGSAFMTLRERCVLPLATLVVIALVTGCRLDGDVEVRLEGDGGGTLAVTLAADRALRDRVDSAGADPLATLRTSVERLPGWRVVQPDDDAGDGADAVTLETTFADPDELARVSGDFGEAVAGPELRPLGPLHVELTDDTVELRGTAGLDPTAQVTDVGLSPARAERVLADSVGYTVSVELPGDVLETDADERTSDTGVRWTIAAGERRDLFVRARRPWTLARVVALLVTPAGLLATAIGVAMIVAWRRAARDQPML
jgi:hypothetical protein